VLTEDHVVENVNNVHDIVFVVLAQVLQDLQLDTRLVVVLFFVFHHFNCHLLLLFVINTAESCAEAA
jgi:hypothetical protein